MTASGFEGPKPPRGDDLPCDDGEPMETARHRNQMNLLIDSLEEAWADRRDFFVGGNMGLYFSETQALRNDFRAPDVFVVLDTDRHERKRWVVWEEDGRVPDVVVELTSESTEEIDRGQKMNVYARMLRVPVYVIYDPWSARLDAFELDLAQRRYRAITPDDRGYVWVQPLQLFLGVVEGEWKDTRAPWLRWIDRDGRAFLHSIELARVEAERARVEAERAGQAEAEVTRLRDEVAALRDELARRGNS
ncbi:MAG: Uma2 family endonuclease [Deltaproteobacteria bacterium]|nr:Uma2 family endonuclease [Deltaproteobacteria bacterium]